MENEKKFKLGGEMKVLSSERTLFRIVALRDFSDVKKGDVGGWVESEKNLSHDGDCWISGDAMVSGNSCVYI